MTYPPQPGQPQQPGQPYYPPPPQQPVKKKRKWPWIILAVIAVIVVISVASKPDKAKEGFEDGFNVGNPGATQVEAPAPIPPLAPAAPEGEGTSVLYEVITDSGELNSVTWFDELNRMQQDSNVAAPWSKALNNSASFSMVGVTAQTSGTSVTCRIIVDGKVEDEQTATGQYALVNCTHVGF